MTQNVQNTGKVYFKGLHALRYFAAVFVLISHIELIKGGIKITNIYGDGSFLAHSLESLGPMGVTFFFVLSGFLITYLLLREKQKTMTVKIKSFYIRRALRIWPIYFIFTLLVFFVLPKTDIFYHYYFSKPEILNHNFYTKLSMYFLFIPGFVLAFYESIPWAGHLWTIGVEEQFYLFWPWLGKKIKKIKIHHFISLFFIIVLIKALILILYFYHILPNEIKQVAAQSKFECMIIGGVGAFLIYKKQLGRRIFQTITRTDFLLLLATLCLAITWFLPAKIDDVKHILLSPIFMAIIIGVSFGENRKYLENDLFVKLGNLSYAFYLYHMVCAVLVMQLIPISFIEWCSQQQGGQIIINIIYYGGSIIVTTAISWLSYSIIEKPFLKLKSKFAIIKSGKI